jgi:DNA-binding CsgD family transcriptional regulator
LVRGVVKSRAREDGTGVGGVRATRRQGQILGLAARDLADKQIAARLGISVSTIRTELERFYKANGLHSKTGAVALWLRSRRGAT